MKLPIISGAEAVKAFERLGYAFDQQHGSHIIMRHASPLIAAYRSPITKSWPKVHSAL